MRTRVLSALLAGASSLPLLSAQQSIPAEHTCRITVDDPLPWVERLLLSEELQRAFRSGAFGDMVAVLGETERISPKQLAAAVGMFRGLVPVEATLAWPPETSGKLGTILRAIVAVLLRSAAEFAEDVPAEDLERLRAEVRAELLEAAQRLVTLHASFSLRCRDARTAGEWFDDMSEAVEAAAQELPVLRFQHFGDSFRIAFVPGEALEEGDLESLLADEFFEDDELAMGLWRLLERVSLRLDASIKDDTLAFRLYPTGTGPIAPVLTEPPEAPPLEGSPMLRFRYDLSDLQKEFDKAIALWERWRQHEVGAIAKEFDTDEFLSDLPTIAGQIRAWSVVSGGISWSDDRLSYAMRSTLGPHVPVHDSPLWRLVPPGAAYYEVDGTTHLAELFHGTLMQVEDRMAQQSLRAELRGSEASEEVDARIAAYYERIGRLRSLFTDRGPEVFAAPTLAVYAAGPTTALAGMALAGRLQRPGTGLDHARELMAATAEAMGIAADDAKREMDRDLGLGVPTVSLSTARLVQLADPGPSLEDVVLHAFEWNGHLVLSTSVALSRSMLAPRDRAVVTPPAANVVRRIGGNGARGAAAISVAAQQVGNAWGRGEADVAEELAQVRTVVQGIADLARMAGAFRFEATVEGDTMLGRGHLMLRASAGDDDATLRAVLERARAALGPWPAGADALIASGTSRYKDIDGEFSFACTQDGRYRNRIASLAHEENGFDGAAAWSLTETMFPRTCGAAERDLLIAWNAILSGSWTDPRAGMRVELADDTLPDAAPELLLRFDDSPTCMRLCIDPETGLLASFALHGDTLVHQVIHELSDWRDVGGRKLPHRVAEAKGEDGRYVVASWSMADLPKAQLERPAPRDDTTFAGAPEVELHGADWPRVRVTAGGKRVWMVFRPGAGYTSISARALAAMGVEVPDGARWVRVPELQIGPMTVRDVPVHVADWQPPADADDDAPATVHGDIGMLVLLRACVELDLAEETLRLYPPGSFDDRELAFVGTDWHFRMPTVPLRLDRKTTVACALEPAPFGQVNLMCGDGLEDFAFPRRGLRDAGRGTALYGMLAAQLPDVRIGDQDLGRTSAGIQLARSPEVARTMPPATIGGTLLEKRCVLYLDLPRERAAFVLR